MSYAAKEIEFPSVGPLVEERAVLEPRRKRTVVEWAQQERVLDRKTSAIPGRFNWEYVPFLREPALCISDMAIRRITVRKCTQAGVTELLNNIIGWAVDESPAPLMLVMPKESDTARRMETRIRPMFEACASLLRHLDGDLERLNVGKETVLDNCIVYLAWATSAAALADSPVCLLLLDEIDKYPDRVGKEGDPASLAEKRQRTFVFAKTIEGSTPTDQYGRIGIDYNAGDRRRWWVRCPHCRRHHVMRWGHVVLDKNDKGQLLSRAEYAGGGRARYVCPDCAVAWSEADRWSAVQAGRWAPGGCSVDAKGRIVGQIPRTNHRSYHISALMLYPGFSSIDKLAGAWAHAVARQKSGDLGPMIDFVNSELGEVWAEAEAATDIDVLREHVEGYEPDTVPPGAMILTAAIDVQQDHFYATVWGWGYGFEGWLVSAQRIETEIVGEGPTGVMDFTPIRQLLGRTWPRVDADGKATGENIPIALTFIDSQYRPDQVYDFCAGFTTGDCWPARGDDSLRDVYMQPSNLEKSASVRRRALLRRAGLQLWRISSYMVKSQLARLMNVPAEGPGYVHLPAGTGEEFLGQMTAEHLKVNRRRNRYGKMETTRIWTLKPEHIANHYWDCSYLALAAARRRGVRNLPDPKAPASSRRRIVRRMSTIERFARE